MTYLLDTNASSDLMESHDAAVVAWARAVAFGDDVCITTINLGEHRYGIERLAPGRRQDRYARRLEELVARLTVLELPWNAIDIYGRIKARAESRGRHIGDNDLWIAATAIYLDATLVTRDRDFDAIEGLRRADWSVTSP